MMRGFMGSLDDMLGGLAPRRILEIGVGEGHVMTRLRERFPGIPMVGLDLPDEALVGRLARARACRACSATPRRCRSPTTRSTSCWPSRCSSTSPARTPPCRELSRVCSGTFIASVPFEPIWRAGNLARRRYVRQLGNTPGHVNHWTRWGFHKFVETRFHVQQVRSPLPWTMVRAIPA